MYCQVLIVSRIRPCLLGLQNLQNLVLHVSTGLSSILVDLRFLSIIEYGHVFAILLQLLPSCHVILNQLAILLLWRVRHFLSAACEKRKKRNQN